MDPLFLMSVDQVKNITMLFLIHSVFVETSPWSKPAGQRVSPAVSRASVRSAAFPLWPELSTRCLGVLLDSPLKKSVHCAIAMAEPGEKTEAPRTAVSTCKTRLVWSPWKEPVGKTRRFGVDPDTWGWRFLTKGKSLVFAQNSRASFNLISRSRPLLVPNTSCPIFLI